jgi:hypothetical protein
MKLTVALTLTLLASTAYAGSPAPAPSPHSDSKSAAVGLGVAKAEGGNAFAAGGTSSATQNQTQSSVSGAEATNAGNSQSLSISSHYEAKRQAASAYAPAIYASGPCNMGRSVAVQTPVGGVSGGKATVDEDCNRRELARVLIPLSPRLALKVLCADPIVAKVAEEGDCIYTAQVVSIESTGPDVPALDLSRYVTREELVEREKRIVERTTRK